MEDTLREAKNMVAANAPEIMSGLQKLVSENEEMKKKIQEFVKEKTEQLKQNIISNEQEINGVTVFKVLLPMGMPEVIKDIAFQLKGQFPENMLFVAGIISNGKPNLTVMLSDNLVAKGLHAGNMVREAAKHIQGGGGGQPHFATAGGKNPDGLNMALEALLQYLT
jgi:alanyl-tRNA synthetase